MRRSGFGFWRLAKQVVLGVAESVASFANTTLTAASATGTADGSTANTLTLTLRDTSNALMPSKAVTFTTELTAVDADESTLTGDATTIEATTGEMTLTFTAKNADGTVLPNIQSARIVYSSTGTGNTFGTPTVTNKYGESTCTFSSTVAEAKTISVTVDGVLVTQTKAVTVSGSAPAAVFESTWSTGTGHTDAVLRSTGESTPWAGVSDTTGVCLEVVSAASVGADSGTLTGYAGNCLRIEFGNSSGDGQLITGNLFAASTDHYYRDYIRSDSGKRSNHGGGTFAVGDLANWQILAHVHRGGTDETADLHLGWEINLNVGGGGRDYQSPALSKATWYRREVWIEFNPSDGTEYRPHFRIYDLSGTLLYDNDDFTRVDGTGGPATLTDDLATVGGWVSLGTVDNPTDVDGTRCWVLGSEDPADATGYNPVTPNYVYHAKVAVSTAGWVGA